MPFRDAHGSSTREFAFCSAHGDSHKAQAFAAQRQRSLCGTLGSVVKEEMGHDRAMDQKETAYLVTLFKLDTDSFLSLA